jgi:hypothetical protein
MPSPLTRIALIVPVLAIQAGFLPSGSSIMLGVYATGS